MTINIKIKEAKVLEKLPLLSVKLPPVCVLPLSISRTEYVQISPSLA